MLINSLTQHVNVPNEVIQYIKTGAVYQFGRDNQHQPILIINLNKIENLDNCQDFLCEAV